MKFSRITKVAGAGLVGFCAVSLVADKANVSNVLSQTAGFVGAFVGSLVASRRQSGSKREHTDGTSSRPASDDQGTKH
jgi:uncharacterized membrane protein YeaQ/YmgE (transglycosylase-associated protein family)